MGKPAKGTKAAMAEESEYNVINMLVSKLLDALDGTNISQSSVLDAIALAARNGALSGIESSKLESFFRGSSAPIEAQLLVKTESGWGIAIDVSKMPEEWREQYSRAKAASGGGCACGGKCSCGS